MSWSQVIIAYVTDRLRRQSCRSMGSKATAEQTAVVLPFFHGILMSLGRIAIKNANSWSRMGSWHKAITFSRMARTMLIRLSNSNQLWYARIDRLSCSPLLDYIYIYGLTALLLGTVPYFDTCPIHLLGPRSHRKLNFSSVIDTWVPRDEPAVFCSRWLEASNT